MAKSAGKLIYRILEAGPLEQGKVVSGRQAGVWSRCLVGGRRSGVWRGSEQHGRGRNGALQQRVIIKS